MIKDMHDQELSKNTIIGVIGGAGPEACIDFQHKLLNLMHTKKEILRDKDHIRVITDNNTELTNRDHHFFSAGNSLQQQISKSLKLLESAGVSVAAIVCNSAHIYFDEIQSYTSIKLINILHVVGNYLKKNNIKKIGLLCSLSMYKSEHYKKILEKYGITVVVPDKKNQIRLAQVIYSIKAGIHDTDQNHSKLKYSRLLEIYKYNLAQLITQSEYEDLEFVSPKKLFRVIIENLSTKEKINHFVLGCTELPLAKTWYKDFDSNFIDPNFLLANALLETALARTQ